MVRDYMMRAYARLADPVCLMHPRADDLWRPCKLRSHPRGHLPYLVVAGGNHSLVNPRATNAEEKTPSANELIDQIGLNNVHVVGGRMRVRMRSAVRELPLACKRSTRAGTPMLPILYQYRQCEVSIGT